MTYQHTDGRWAVKRAVARATVNPLTGKRLTPPQKGVLMQLGDMADESGCCWPGVARLAERTAFSERCVRGALRDLEAMGVLCTHRGGGRGKSNEFALQAGALQLAAAVAEAVAKVPQKEAENPAPAAGNGDTKPGINPAADDTKPGTSCPRITKKANINTNTPPTPSRGLDPSPLGRSGLASGSGGGRGQGAELLSLRDWLAACQRRGEVPIPADDAVFAYAEAVGLPAELVALAWQQFKRRRLGSGRRRRDWRQAFRESVESCAYRLWRFSAEGGAVLTTEGQQAQRFFAQAGESVGAVAA